MQVNIDLNTILALIAAFIAISGWFVTWRKAVMKEGERRKEIEQMGKRIETLEIKSVALDGCTAETNGVVRELKNDMDWMKKALERIEGLLQLRPSL